VAGQSPETVSHDKPRKRRRRKSGSPQLGTITENNVSTAVRHEELVRMAIQPPLEPRTNWTTTIGQLCAYGGVALLTLGTVMVLSGYFGGPSNYSPTGWLVAAVGQMLLFLGVVTLVSGGMEQTVDEVAWRIDLLSERIVHLEQLLSERDDRRARRREEKNRRSDPPPQDQVSAA
jgi:hypothetical protein